MHVSVMNSEREARYPDSVSLFNFSKKRDARVCDEPQKGCTRSGSGLTFQFFEKKGMHVSVMNCKREVRYPDQSHFFTFCAKRDARICDGKLRWGGGKRGLGPCICKERDV